MRYLVFGTPEEARAWAVDNGVDPDYEVRQVSTPQQLLGVRSAYWPHVYLDSFWRNPQRDEIQQRLRINTSHGARDYVVDRRGS